MATKKNRRQFVKDAALTGVGVWVAGGVSPVFSKSPNEKVHLGCVGVGGKGDSDSGDAARMGTVIGLCDVDKRTLKKAAERPRFKDAQQFQDFREMLQKLGDKIDAVTVSTPDHMHATIAATAMRMGKHAFVQKPITRCIYEARVLGDLAREKKLKTQMGNQGTSSNGLRKAAAMVRAGVIGEVKEVHAWTNRPVWPQGIDRPKPSKAPVSLDWNLWLGVAPDRPYAEDTYHTFKWRGWWDFGSGDLGDMACHTLNLPFAALNLRNPTSVVAEHAGHNRDSFPKWTQILFDFPANDKRPGLKVTWYSGGKKPDPALLKGKKPAGSGSIMIGEKGSLLSNGDYGDSYEILSDSKIEEPKVEFEKSPGHFEEFIRAIQGGPEAMSNFPDYAGPLTETILLGNLAVWANKKVEWDAKALVAKNAPEVSTLIKPTYRDGYAL